MPPRDYAAWGPGWVPPADDAVGADRPAEVRFTETEREGLRVYARTHRLPEQTDLVSAVWLVAMMGGDRNRSMIRRRVTR